VPLKKHTPRGELNTAMPTAPSRKPAVPVPARVATVPSGATVRTRWLVVSPTYTMEVMEFTATPLGELNMAAKRLPSANPAVPLPAYVVTALLSASTRRTRWLL
jgi:hypothetical protein